MSIPFVGRKFELNQLNSLLNKKSASIVVVKGRRRIGKSRLIDEFAKSREYFYSFAGLPPTKKTTAQSQRDEFARQLGEQFGLPGLAAKNWGDLFVLLSKQTTHGRQIILLDEISWMGNLDPDFLGHLKTTWDKVFSKNSQLILILCGSISSWIEKNILSSTGFFGRISLEIVLEELSLIECNKLLNYIPLKGSDYERFKLLSVTGGIPWYLEQIQSGLNVDDNINKLCFTKNGLLVTEFEKIFHDLFDHKGHWYKRIAEVLAEGPAEYNTICKKIDYQSSGRITELLDDMIKTGFVRRDYAWHFASRKESRFCQYRLKDNYLRFYLKYIEPNYNKIQKNQYANISMSSFPGWDSMMGLQFENLVLNNRDSIFNALGIRAEDVVADNPYFQRKNNKRPGCQIDYLIQTRFNALFICEIKFSRNSLSRKIIGEVKEKIERLDAPKNFARIPVLIHINNISNEVLDDQYFAEIIDFNQLLKSDNLNSVS